MSRLTKAELRRAIEKEQSEYTPEQLFSDGSMKPILESIIIGACRNLNRYPGLSVHCDPDSDFTAATDGLSVLQNTLGPLIRELPTNWEKYVANVGHTVHETGHVLFTPFRELHFMFEAWDRGVFYPSAPDGADDVKKALEGKPRAAKLYSSLMKHIENTIEDAYIENLLRVIFDGVAVQGISLVNKEIYRKMGTKKEVVANVMANGIPPLSIAEALLLSRHVCQKELPEGDLSPDEELILSFAEAVLKTAESEINDLLWEQDGEKRAMLYNSLYVKFFPLFSITDSENSEEDDSDEEGEGKEGKGGKGSSSGSSAGKNGKSENCSENPNPSGDKPSEGSESSGKASENDDSSSSSEKGEKKESEGSGSSEKKDGADKSSEGKGSASEDKEKSEDGGNSGKGSSDGTRDISEKELQRIIKEAERRSKEVGKSEAPEVSPYASSPTPIQINESDKEKAKEKTMRADNAGEVNGTLALSRAIKDVAAQRVLEKDEKEHTKDLAAEARTIDKNAVLYIANKGFTEYYLQRPLSGDIGEYNKIYRDVQRTSRNLVRKINNIMREREVESVDSGFMMGQRFNAKDIVNRDGKYFSRQIIPDGKITVAFGILVDESGSMNFYEKKERARRTAILIEDVLRTLDVPLMVTGHSTGYPQGHREQTLTVLNCYKDFDTRDGKDYLRLTNITAKGGNIDGAAITYMGEKLLKRPETKKVLIVISDGEPAGHSFYSNFAKEDTKLAAQHYRKKGVEVFGAVLDEVMNVSQLYGEDYCFDCRSDGELERQLVRLIKKYVLMKG